MLLLFLWTLIKFLRKEFVCYVTEYFGLFEKFDSEMHTVFSYITQNIHLSHQVHETVNYLQNLKRNALKLNQILSLCLSKCLFKYSSSPSQTDIILKLWKGCQHSPLGIWWLNANSVRKNSVYRRFYDAY